MKLSFWNNILDVVARIRQAALETNQTIYLENVIKYYSFVQLTCSKLTGRISKLHIVIFNLCIYRNCIYDVYNRKYLCEACERTCHPRVQ